MTIISQIRSYLKYIGLIGGLSALVLILALPARAQVEGISYSLSPTGEYIFFSRGEFLGAGSSSGLDNSRMYGGQLGLGFGQYLELEGLYLQGSNFTTNFDKFDDDVLGPDTERPEFWDALGRLDARAVDVKRYGGTLRLNLGSGIGSARSGNFLPYLTVGSGIIQFDADQLFRSESIYATGGLGLTFSLLDRFTVSLGGDVLAYNYNPATALLTEQDLETANDAAGLSGTDRIEGGDFSDLTVFAPSLNASIQFHLGGRRPGELSALDRAFIEQFRGGRGPEIFVEPFYGRITFNNALNFPKDQNVTGVNVGLELGPYVGLRGFYWRGVSGETAFDEFGEGFEDIAFYGGELNLRFENTVGGQSLTPYGIIGGGYMNVLDGYDDAITNGMLPDNRYFATGGGGIDLALGDNLSVFGNLRYLLMSNTDAAEVSDPDAVFGSPMYTAGLKFSFGGRDSPTAEQIIEDREARRAEEARQDRDDIRGDLTTRDEAVRAELARLHARLDSLQGTPVTERDRQPTEPGAGGTLSDVAEEVEELEQKLAGDTGERRPVSNLSGTSIQIPVPERGEIYLRFGETDAGETTTETVYRSPATIQPGAQAVAPYPGTAAGGLSAERIQQIVRRTLQDEMARADSLGRSLSNVDLQRMVEETVNAQLGQINATGARSTEIGQIQNRLDRIDRRLDRLADRPGGATLPPTTIIEDDEEGTATTTRVVGTYRPSTVIPTAAFGGNRFYIGVRGDYSDRSANIGSLRFSFMPELMLGVSDGLRLDVIANAVAEVNALDRYMPSENIDPYVGAGIGLTSKIGFGINLLVGSEFDVGSGGIIVEYSNLDLFNYNRFLIGYRTGL